MRRLLLYALLPGFLLCTGLRAQERPVPYPVFYPPAFEQAIENGTRTTTGQPGPDYWINTAHYEIEATLSPATRTLRGTETIHYYNNAPDTLHRLVVFLRQNIYREGAVRNTALQVTGGMTLAHVAVDGQPLVERDRLEAPGYVVEHTLMQIVPPAPVAPGDTVRLDLAWDFRVHDEGPSPREGTDGEVFYLGYWYPQMAVYDDVQGWDTDPFRQWAEFYMDPADYDVRITVPEGWLVAATGTLQNPEAVLSEQTRARLAQVGQTQEVVPIVTADERAAGTSTATSPAGTLTWHFAAEDVRDFAFGASDRYLWDATVADTGDPEDGRALIHAFYRPGTPAWNRAAEFGRFAIAYLSDLIMPYPYPQMTSVEGVVGGGMEFPMITIMSSNRTDRSLFGVSVHEISHMWFPMIVGSQETDFSWMDEGLTTFNTREAVRAFWEGEDPWAPSGGYFNLAGSGREQEVMRHGDQYGSVGQLVTASYDKTGRLLHALRGLYGDARFLAAYRAYAERWAFKHPYPWDFFNTMEAELGEELDWFWRPWFYDTWTLDQAVAGVETTPEGVRVRVADHGLAPMPVLLEVTYADGRTETRRLPVATWLEGRRTADATFPAGTVTRVAIDPAAYLPDVDRANNVWEAAGE